MGHGKGGFSWLLITFSDLNVFVGPAGAKEASPNSRNGRMISGACYAATLLPGLEKGDTVMLYQCNQKGSKGSELQNMSFSSPANLESMVKRIS